MKIDLSSAGRFQETISRCWKKLANLGLRGGFMRFHIAPLATSVILQSPTHGLESIVNRLPQFFMRSLYLQMFDELVLVNLLDRTVQAWLPLDHQFSPWQGQV